ncbi:MAG: type I DNA topoisomerase [Actinobacteria bacterium]|nr:type I DNA topoisomerase [Actinomycetota bacterium]
MSDNTLVIVESPAKAKKIAGYLGDDYTVLASVGHVRDLASKASEIPAEDRKKPWAKLAVNVDDAFQAYYVVHESKKATIKELKAALKDADELLLATDEDREGEAISWHLLEVLKPKVPVKRMVFNEITPEAIREAVNRPRELDMRLVEAQETRRIVDRLYGYPVSEVLWKKIGREAKSAGRVQSVAVRLVVDRERERIAFTPVEYWGIDAQFLPGPFPGRLATVDGARVATGSDFDDDGRLSREGAVHLDEASAQALTSALAGRAFTVDSVTQKPSSRKPKAPFMTSTLQQEASGRLRWGAQRTMRVAQSLYENGYITYMRTDSTTLSEQALNAARSQARELYGSEYVPDKPRLYDRKVKNAQEAHEAIRPSGDSFRSPAEIAGELVGDEFALYDLIWKRTVASQMVNAQTATTTVRLSADSTDGRHVEFTASGTVITFPGFMAALKDVSNDDDERELPALSEGQQVDVESLTAEGHSTKPPARYNEASLVAKLEELGIGRPSTYASIMSTILDRGYVWKKGSALVPSFTAFAVIRLLEEHFAALIDYDFTANMENVLDLVASGDVDRVQQLEAFWRGGTSVNGDFPGVKALTEDLGSIDARGNATFPIKGSDANLLLAEPSGDRELGIDPETELMIVAKSGRYGPYVSEVLPEGSPKSAKPRTASLLSDMKPSTVTLDDALKLIRLPRVVGVDPSDGEEIRSQNGRYGPYLTKGTDSRSLESEEQIFSVTLEQALALFAQPKQRRGRGQPAAPLREVGADPTSGRLIVVREGRFGAYVTDGETNATLRVVDDPMTVSIERASDLLAERKAKGPSKKTTKRSTKKTTKKAAKKTSKKTTKKAAKKSTRAKVAAAPSAGPVES